MKTSFTDFPMPGDYPTFPSAKQMELYLESYAAHFDLNRRIVFHTAVQTAQRDAADEAWLITTKDLRTGKEDVQKFDRLVLATGILHAKNVPDIKGLDQFAGDAIHSRAFKNPTKYKGKNVLVVGIGATGADTACFLKDAGANQVYVSHRGSFYVLPRMVKGKAFDHGTSRRMGTFIRFIGSLAPRFTSSLMGKGMRSMVFKNFPFLASHPSFAPSRMLENPLHRLPFFSDKLPYHLRDGTVITVPGISEVSGPRSVLLTDGRELTDLDAIIICSGYSYDSTIIQGKGDPVDPSQAPDNFEQFHSAPFCNPQRRFPRLYHGFLSEQYPESLAVVGQLVIMKPIFVVYDLVAMSIASMWAGNAPLPSKEEMKRDIDGHYKFVVKTLHQGPMPHLGFRTDYKELYAWLNRTAGTGVMEKLGWGREGWSFWWQDRKFHKLLMNGLDLPMVYRLFDTEKGRASWLGARAAIEQANDEVEAMGRAWEESKSKKSK
ncbi:hypothetical protein ACHAQH_006565 [Verticillium albo-atrum]